jgi:hypothetical protein
MTKSIVVVTRLRMPAFGFAAMSAEGICPSAHNGAVAYTQLAARNDAQGGVSAWSPPV